MKHLFLILGLLGFSSAQAFTDTGDSPYQSAIAQLATQGVVEGYNDDTFKPQASINRAEFLKILLETKFKNQVTYQSRSDKACFTDVPSPAWYRPYACVGLDRGIITGYPDGSFGAANAVTKAEAAKILHNVYFKNISTKTTPWYAAYYTALDREGILLNLFTDPSAALTRGEMAFAVQQFEVYPAHQLLPPSVKPTAVVPPQAGAPVVLVEPEPQPNNTPIVAAQPIPPTPTPAANTTEVSPLRVFTTPHPGAEVTGGYISSYKQWKAARYQPSLNNNRISRSEAQRLAAEVLAGVNDERVASGGTRLSFDADLQNLSQNFADHLVINAVYSHSDMLGQDPFDRAKAAGITGFVAESMVWRKRDPQSSIAWWKNSALHWNNISNERFTRAGVGVAQEPSGSYIVVLLQGE